MSLQLVYGQFSSVCVLIWREKKNKLTIKNFLSKERACSFYLFKICHFFPQIIIDSIDVHFSKGFIFILSVFSLWLKYLSIDINVCMFISNGLVIICTQSNKQSNRILQFHYYYYFFYYTWKDRENLLFCSFGKWSIKKLLWNHKKW